MALPGGFFAVQVTVNANTVFSLFTLISLNISVGQSAQPTCTELSIQVDGAAAGTLKVGDAAIGTGRYGYALISPGSGVPSPIKEYGGGKGQSIPIRSLYVLSTENITVNVSGRIN